MIFCFYRKHSLIELSLQNKPFIIYDQKLIRK